MLKKPKTLIPVLIVVLLVVAVAVGCTFTGANNKEEVSESGIIPLTEEEVEQANKALEPFLFDDDGNKTGVNPISHFFKCYYDRPEDINLAEFLRYFPSETVTDEAEVNALKSDKSFPFGAEATVDRMSDTVHKITAESVNVMLQRYTGIKLDDLSGIGAEDLLYLEEYDAYYNFTSDFATGTFRCTHGERDGDIVRLFYSDQILLTLKKQGDDYLIVSHQRVEEETALNTANNKIGNESIENFPQAVVDYAVDYVAKQDNLYNEAGEDLPDSMGTYTITDTKITGLTQINTGTAELTSGINMYLLEYRLRPDYPENIIIAGGMQMEKTDEEDWITEWSSMGQPYLLLAWDDSGTETTWQRVCATNTLTIEEEYHTTEMLERYGNAFTAAAMELYQKSLDIDQLPESSVLLASLPDDQIHIYGEKNDYDTTGAYDGLYLSINGVNRYYEWQNTGKESFLPELILRNINGDGKKELIVILTIGEGTGFNQKAVHVINPENFTESGVEDPLNIIEKNVDTSIMHGNGSVTVTITVNGQKSVVTLPEDYARGWAEDKASFGSIVTYEVDGAELKATVPAQISNTVFVGDIIITYAFDGSQYIMKTIEYVPFEF